MKKRTIYTTLLLWGIVSIALGQQQLPSNLQSILRHAQPGDLVELPDFLSTEFPKVAWKKTVVPGPQFLISDDPEYIRIPEAIAMQEAVSPGAVRLYVYNVNGVKEPQKIPRKITAVLKNTGKEELHLRMLKYSSQKPSTNYFQIGKQGLADYFGSQVNGGIRKVKPGEVIALDEQLEKNVVQYDELVHGFYEFIVDQPALIAILQTDPGKSGPKAFSEIDTLIPHSHVNAGRGIFPIANYKIDSRDTLSTAQGVQQLILADGNDDPWITGTIGVDRQPAKNAGNYGVMYDTSIKWKSTDGKGMALVTWNSRSADNQWCGGMGLTVELFDEAGVKTIKQMPAKHLITRKAPEAIVLGVYKPVPGKTVQEIKLTYSPPGASCLPTPLVLVPVDLDE